MTYFLLQSNVSKLFNNKDIKKTNSIRFEIISFTLFITIQKATENVTGLNIMPTVYTFYPSARCNNSKPTKYGKAISVSFDTKVIQSRQTS